MFELIDKLRRKPEAQRRKLVFVVSASIATVIFALWGISIVTKVRAGGFSIVEKGEGSAAIRERLASVKDAWSSFIDQAGEAFGGASTTLER